MNLEQFTKGWLVGDFEPALFKTKDIEVGIKYYKAGDKEEKHYHKVATEYSIILYGTVSMLNQTFKQGQIVTVLPDVENKFECLEDACIVVIKTPSVIGDKYIT
jgi:predicted DNA-binding ArsR family transcriptional regulator